jgi:seryl-tRNA synthetase
MLDIKFIRENPGLVEKSAKNKKVEVNIKHLLEIDKKNQELNKSVQDLQAKRNAFSKNIKGKPTEEQLEEGRQIKEKLEKEENAFNAVNEELSILLKQIPNIPHESVPVGKDESENVEVRRWGEPKKFSFKVRDHVELGEIINGIDTESASKITGSRFTYLKGDVALLQFALLNFALEILTSEEKLKSIADKVEKGFNPKPFIPVITPVMIRPEIFARMARLEPKEERYYIPQDDTFLIGSAEHVLGPLHMDEHIAEKNLPIRYVGYSTAFRREAGSYGKDIKGILRLHQFDKLEMESFTSSENSVKEQDFFVAIQEHFMQQLNIPYRVMMICTGDMGAPDARQIDIECWIPSQDKYRETHTSDLMTDYQSRRLNTRIRRSDGKSELAHMNDATAIAIGRTLIAILENYQQEDGSISIPEVLRKYIGKDSITPKNL